MSYFARSCIKKGKSSFTCPYESNTGVRCGVEWPYFVVRHVAALDTEDMKMFDTKISENYLRKARGIQQCPGCQSWCARQDVKNNRVRCVVCTFKPPDYRPFEFCWACLSQWPASSKKCGNPNCDGTDPQVHYLATCATKRINGIEGDVPNTRACPSCGILVEHKDKCKHMTCTACQQEFCFVCLNLRSMNGEWSCGSFNTNCEVAPRQTTLPGKILE